jgi:hypothetical protein
MHGGRSRSVQTTKSAQPASWHPRSQYLPGHTICPILHCLMRRLIEVVVWILLKRPARSNPICGLMSLRLLSIYVQYASVLFPLIYLNISMAMDPCHFPIGIVVWSRS